MKRIDQIAAEIIKMALTHIARKEPAENTDVKYNVFVTNHLSYHA